MNQVAQPWCGVVCGFQMMGMQMQPGMMMPMQQVMMQPYGGPVPYYGGPVPAGRGYVSRAGSCA